MNMRDLYQLMREEDLRRKGEQPKEPRELLTQEQDQRIIRERRLKRWDEMFEKVLSGELKANDPMVLLAMFELQNHDRIIIESGNQHLFHED